MIFLFQTVAHDEAQENMTALILLTEETQLSLTVLMMIEVYCVSKFWVDFVTFKPGFMAIRPSLQGFR